MSDPGGPSASQRMFGFEIVSLHYQAQGISLEVWAQLFTLCLTPLLFHVAVGAPEPSCLSTCEPRWHDQICHFNPTSIVWRYIAIADRRIRARAWNAADMAASNALFWTSNGWDGSEDMVLKTLSYSSRLPRRPRVNFISWEALKTLIITLQGASAAMNFGYSLLELSNPGTSYMSMVAVSDIFAAVTIFGLFRLTAALWLTRDFAYVPRDDKYMRPLVEALDLRSYKSFGSESTFSSVRTTAYVPTEEPHRFYSAKYWPSRVFRCFTFLVLLLFWLMCLLSTTPAGGTLYSSTSSLLVGLLYLVFLTVSVVIFGYYMGFGDTTTTVIPCISTMWYKIYTIMLVAAVAVLLVLSALETRLSPCGWYVSGPPEWDYLVCGAVASLTS